MVDFYQLDPPPVHAAGQRVTGLSAVTAGLTTRYGAVLGTAEQAVGHPVVAAAVRRFADRWQPPAGRIAGQVTALGTNTSGSAAVITDCDLTAASTLAVTGTLTGTSALCRAIDTINHVPPSRVSRRDKMNPCGWSSPVRPASSGDS
jgi:hypothetical protein